jgi:5,10-methenyltetrahydrofolate synthetase
MLRAQLRQDRLAARARLTPAEHAERSRRICALLADLLAPKTPAALGACLPFRGECDVLPLLRTMHAWGWRLCVPVVEAASRPMGFRGWHPDVALTRDRHGIEIPDSSPVAAPDILLLPVVAVDAAGYRLGYGGGYFDRTLAELAARNHYPWSIGVGFSLARITSICPQAHDQPLRTFVCEDGIIEFATPPHAAIPSGA